MNNQAIQYVRGIFLRNEVVYIDASALMNFDELSRFLEKYGTVIRETGTVIIIPAAVRCEIASFLGSEDEDKDYKALECMSVLAKYSDLFELEGGDLSDVDYEDVFADPYHLAALILGGTSIHQLLITNDVALSQDSYSMNHLKSCKGRRAFCRRPGDCIDSGTGVQWGKCLQSVGGKSTDYRNSCADVYSRINSSGNSGQ